MDRILPCLALASACALALGCSKPKPPTVTARSANITRVSMLGMEVEADLSVYNPNDIELSVKSVTGKVTLDHKYEIGSFSVDKAVVLPAKKRINVKVPISVPWGDINVMGLAEMGVSNRDIDYLIDGSANIGGDILNVNLPFQIKGKVTHAELTKIAGPASNPKITLPF